MVLSSRIAQSTIWSRLRTTSSMFVAGGRACHDTCGLGGTRGEIWAEPAFAWGLSGGTGGTASGTDSSCNVIVDTTFVEPTRRSGVDDTTMASFGHGDLSSGLPIIADRVRTRWITLRCQVPQCQDVALYPEPDNDTGGQR